MFKLISQLFTILLLILNVLSCNNNSTNPVINTLNGNWYDVEYPDSTYNFDGKHFSSSYLGNIGYQIQVEEIVLAYDINFIIGKYTINAYDDKVIGKYYCVSYKNLKSDSVEISGAYSSDNYTFDSFTQAKENFTKKNNNGSLMFFSSYSLCKRK